MAVGRVFLAAAVLLLGAAIFIGRGHVSRLPSSGAKNETSPTTSNAPATDSPDASNMEPPYHEAELYATAEQLINDRQTGGAAAAEKDVGKIIEMQGVVNTADAEGNSPSISFKATGLCPIPGGNRVECLWMADRERNAVANLHPGDIAIVLGKFAESGRYYMPKDYDFPGCAYYVRLRNCTVLAKPTQPVFPEDTVASDASGASEAARTTEKPVPQASSQDEQTPVHVAPIVRVDPATLPAGTLPDAGSVGTVEDSTEPQLHVGGSVRPPVLIHQVDPEFSEAARAAKFSGKVEVYLIVDKQGNPTHIRVARGVGMGLDQKAVEAVSQYKFKPAMQNGEPVSVDLYIDVAFQIF